MEYTLHRFLFHGEDYWMCYLPESKYIYTMHFMMHGIHHSFPQDRYRLLFPPLLGNILYYGIIKHHILIYGLPMEYNWPIWAGINVGYLFYDEIHWF